MINLVIQKAFLAIKSKVVSSITEMVSLKNFLILKTQCCKECKECHRPTDTLSEEFVIRHNKFSY